MIFGAQVLVRGVGLWCGVLCSELVGLSIQFLSMGLEGDSRECGDDWAVEV